MVRIKKAFIFSVAILALAGQVHAGDRDSLTPEQRQEQLRKAAESAGKHVSAATDARTVSANVDKSGAVSLSPDQHHNLQLALVSDKTGETSKIVNDALANMSSNPDLNKAIIEGLANTPAVDESPSTTALLALDDEARNAHSASVLFKKVLPASRGWTQGQSAKVATRLAVEFNTNVRGGMKPGAALLAARDTVQAQVRAGGSPEFKLNLDDILKSCRAI